MKKISAALLIFILTACAIFTGCDASDAGSADLDYSGDVCGCQPEYIVDTEFGSDYGISLTEYYARHDGRQVQLTEEQVLDIQEIIDKHCASRTNCYPDENVSR